MAFWCLLRVLLLLVWIFGCVGCWYVVDVLCGVRCGMLAYCGCGCCVFDCVCGFVYWLSGLFKCCKLLDCACLLRFGCGLGGGFGGVGCLLVVLYDFI